MVENNVSETHWQEFFEHEFIGNWGFKSGVAQCKTIDKIDRQEMFNPGTNQLETKPVLHFIGEELKMVLNVTNSERIESIHGKWVEGWHGKRIAIYLSETTVAGVTKPCLRVGTKEPPPDVDTVDISAHIANMMKRD